MRRVSLSIVLVGLLACGAPQKEADTLAESIRSFNDGVRWQRYAVAASKIPPKQRGQFVDEMDELADDLHITDYEIVRVDARGSREARVQIKVTWYRDSDGIVRDTTAVQTWERHGKAWYMVDASRQRGAAMPGLVDRLATPLRGAAHEPAADAAMQDPPGQENH